MATWITKEGKEIDVDDMSVTHLRNTLKLIINSGILDAVLIKSKPKPKGWVGAQGEIAQEHEDMAMLYNIDPSLTCSCDEIHICQQCAQ